VFDFFSDFFSSAVFPIAADALDNPAQQPDREKHDRMAARRGGAKLPGIVIALSAYLILRTILLGFSGVS
jgi:hypothetical protein